MAKFLILIGIILIIIGGIMYFAPNIFSWFGKMPGDIRIKTAKTQIFFPIVSMIILSIIFTIIINLFKK